MKQYDAIIIGFGKGGKTLAAELAKRNEKVAVIERSDEMYGGTCINIGCIPTKTLVHQAKLAPVKASWEEKKAYYAQAIAEKEEVTSFLRQKNYHNLADNPHITVYTGIGSFVSTDVVEVPASNLKKEITKILFDKGYILNYKFVEDGPQGTIKVALKYDAVNKVNAIKKLERVSTPGMRKYTGYKDMPRVINGLGIAIISTSKGVMTDKEAAELKIGGEVLCYVY